MCRTCGANLAPAASANRLPMPICSEVEKSQTEICDFCRLGSGRVIAAVQNVRNPRSLPPSEEVDRRHGDDRDTTVEPAYVPPAAAGANQASAEIKHRARRPQAQA